MHVASPKCTAKELQLVFIKQAGVFSQEHSSCEVEKG